MNPLLKPGSTASDDNMIPLINIVFLLLIFFMVAGQIQKRPDESIELPTYQADANDAVIEKMLTLTSDGRVRMNNEEVAVSELASMVGRSAISLTLVADKNATAKQLESVLSVLRGRDDISLSLLIGDDS